VREREREKREGGKREDFKGEITRRIGGQ
jgi:hypothetical protein